MCKLLQEPFIASQIRTAAAKGAKDSFVQLLTIIEASLLPARGKKGREKRVRTSWRSSLN